jgi:uncharacterized repeat protein (TIGR01451 family)
MSLARHPRSHRSHTAGQIPDFRWRISLLVMGCLGLSFISASRVASQESPKLDPKLSLSNQASYTYDAVTLKGQTIRYENRTGIIQGEISDRLVDPLGRIVGCAGEVLPTYAGFSTALYDVDPTDPTGTNLGALVPLTRTELPDLFFNKIPAGLAPNTENSNPYFLAPSGTGEYNFLLDPTKGQLDPGKSYIFVINPPRNSIYTQRRIRLTITSRTGDLVTYTATAIDGKGLTLNGNQVTLNGTIQINNAATTQLVLSALNLQASVCQAQEVQIVKTADRATANPGDTVIYRLVVRNLASANLKNLVMTDELPIGFRYREGSALAELRGQRVPVTAAVQGRSLVFTLPQVEIPAATDLAQAPVINLAYGATLTPDAIRGNGRNLASIQAQRSDNNQTAKDGPSSHQLRIRSGLLSDCGTILGRVFDDKNFDGEQQPNEPGIANAVVFLDDGNRITTDKNGLFSVANVIAGYRTGVLDLSSIPGYTLAPNRKFKERNSQSRLVHLAPSGLVRMNFAVTPAAPEGQ